MLKQKMIWLILNGLSITFLLGAGNSVAQTQSAVNQLGPKYLAPWFGTFNLSGTDLVMEPWEDGIKMTIGAGKNKMVAFGRMDGKVYPETGNQRSDGLIFNPIDDHSYEFVGTKNGEIVVRVTVSYSPDRMTRYSKTTFLSGEKKDGPPVVSKRKIVPGTEPMHGMWKQGETTLIFEPWEDGFTFMMNAPASQPDGKYMHASGFARMDGKDYIQTGNPFHDSMSFRKIDDRTHEVTSKKDGKVVRVSTISISLDGKTRTTKVANSTEPAVVWNRVDW